MAALPTYQPTQALSAGGSNEFIATVSIAATQAAFPQFIINLGSLPAINTHFPYIRGLTIDNAANLSGVQFVVSAIGSSQTWTIVPGSWQVIRIAGNVTDLLITPLLWTAGSVSFTLWNTIPPQDVIQFATSTTQSSLVTPATLTHTLFLTTVGTTPSALIPGAAPGQVLTLQSLLITATGVFASGAGYSGSLISVFPTLNGPHIIDIELLMATGHSNDFITLASLEGLAISVPSVLNNSISCSVSNGTNGTQLFVTGNLNFFATYQYR